LWNNDARLVLGIQRVGELMIELDYDRMGEVGKKMVDIQELMTIGKKIYDKEPEDLEMIDSFHEDWYELTSDIFEDLAFLVNTAFSLQIALDFERNQKMILSTIAKSKVAKSLELPSKPKIELL
jgi:hypothetical protein